MDPTLALILGVFMRWLHIMSVVVVIGGLFYASGSGGISPAFRGRIYLGTAGILLSGFYNFFTKASYPPGYHMWFGIKVLLALHVFAVLLLLAGRNSNPAKHRRWIVGVLISSTAVIAVSAYLRWITLSPVVKLP